MRYIKAKFKQSRHAPDAYGIHGFDSLWNKKTQMMNGAPVEKGSITDLQAIEVQYDGKCLILNTERNIKKMNALIKAGQLSLAPGESLDRMATEDKKAVEDVWAAPSVELVDDADFSDVDATEIPERLIAHIPKAKKEKAKFEKPSSLANED